MSFYSHPITRPPTPLTPHYTAADAAWWAEESARMAEARERAELDAEVEAMAEDSHQFARYMADEHAYALADGELCEACR